MLILIPIAKLIAIKSKIFTKMNFFFDIPSTTPEIIHEYIKTKRQKIGLESVSISGKILKVGIIVVIIAKINQIGIIILKRNILLFPISNLYKSQLLNKIKMLA